MISDQPTVAFDEAKFLVDKVRGYIAKAREAAKDGLTWAEFGTLLVALLRLCIAALDSVKTLTGGAKKSLVLEAAAMLFDSLADKAVPALAYPVWLVARPAVRALVLALAGGAVEILLPMVRATE